MKWAPKQYGFTIVELLIVVVVIAILATLTIVSYNGITQRATESAILSEVSQANDKIELYRIAENTPSYPGNATLAGISAKSGTLTYLPSGDGQTYCVQVQKGTTSYFATNDDTTPRKGSCLNSGLVAQWKLNGSALDATTNANDGSFTGGYVAAAGQNGVSANAMTFSSTNYVSVGHSSAISADAQSFSFWVRPTSWATATASTFLAKRSPSTAGYFIAYVNGSSSLVFDCGGSGQRWVTGYAPPLNAWTHIVLTCSTSGETMMYVNGTAQPAGPTVNRAAMGTGTGDLKLGIDSSGTGLSMNGALDDVRIYSRVLSGSDAAALFSANAK